jgi:hypothetical protein
MEFTFGIITDGSQDIFIEKIILSIVIQKIENYEIIIVGNSKIKSRFVKIIEFNENIRRGWITRKKNIISENAKYENIVFIHDYVIFGDDWYNGFKKFGNNFQICVSKIKNLDGRRFRDYTFFPWYFNPILKNALIPYDVLPSLEFNKFRYISGSYYIIKKDISLKYKLNEKLLHCQGEDVELCERLTIDNILLDFNKYSEVSFLKLKGQCDWENEVDIDFIEKYIIPEKKWSPHIYSK